jgi:hypothetical protein
MSRNTTRAKARVEELADELAVGAALRLRDDVERIRPIVEAVVAYLTEEYPSQDLYIPASARYPAEDVRADFRAGMSMRSICLKYRISRKTAYRLLDSDD